MKIVRNTIMGDYGPGWAIDVVGVHGRIALVQGSTTIVMGSYDAVDMVKAISSVCPPTCPLIGVTAYDTFRCTKIDNVYIKWLCREIVVPADEKYNLCDVIKDTISTIECFQDDDIQNDLFAEAHADAMKEAEQRWWGNPSLSYKVWWDTC